MHWICVDCKQKLDNNKSVGKDALQYLENQTKSLQLNTGSEESVSTEIETILEDKERTNTAEIETQTVTASVEAQTEEIQTTNMHTQTIPEETTQTIPEETTQTIAEETTQTIAEETTQTIPEETTQTIPEETTQTIPEETQTIPEE